MADLGGLKGAMAPLSPATSGNRCIDIKTHYN